MDVNEYIDIPFKNKGRTKDGADCWGLVRIVLHEQFGVQLPDLLDGYNSAFNSDAVSGLIEIQKGVIAATKQERPENGDIALIAIGGIVCHVGVYIDGMILHIERGKDAILERIDSLDKRAKIKGYYRVC